MTVRQDRRVTRLLTRRRSAAVARSTRHATGNQAYVDSKDEEFEAHREARLTALLDKADVNLEFAARSSDDVVAVVAWASSIEERHLLKKADAVRAPAQTTKLVDASLDRLQAIHTGPVIALEGPEFLLLERQWLWPRDERL